MLSLNCLLPYRHAEMNCVDCIEELIESKKLDRKSFYRKIEVYVNVEPCIMCASALLQLEASHAMFHGSFKYSKFLQLAR